MSKRKSSTKLKLALMGTTAFVLAGCGGEEQTVGKFYNNTQQCVAESQLTKEECDQAYDAALAQHQTTAPRYNSQSLCEEQHAIGTCQPHYPQQNNSTTSYWMPFFAGYFVSSTLSNLTNSTGYDWDRNVRTVYQSRTGLYTASGARVSRNGDTVSVSKRSMSVTPKPVNRVQTRATVVARGGFGSSFSGRSSGG